MQSTFENKIITAILEPWYKSLKDPAKAQKQVLADLVRMYSKKEYDKERSLVFDMKNVRVLIFGISMVWLVVGLLLTPVVEDIMLNFGYFVRSSICWDVWCHEFFFIILALIVAVAFVGRAKGVFDRFVASFSLVFHSFPVLAWFLEPALYIMVFPVGIFALLCSPLNPLFVFPPTRWLLEKVMFSHVSWHVSILWLLGICLSILLFPL